MAGHIIPAIRFNPPWWLCNGHIQTLWPSLLRPQPKVLTQRQRIELPDGDFVDVDFADSGQKDSTKPLVLILTGLQGSAQSKYAAGLLQALSQQHYLSAVMHFRGCSGSLNRLPRLYHSGDTGDALYVLNVLRERYPQRMIIVLGFSLGGNALLKLLAEIGNSDLVQAAMAISVPFNLAGCADRLNRGFSRVYQWHLLRSMHQIAQQKHALQQLPGVDMAAVMRSRSFWAFDDAFTAPLHGFTDVQQYYVESSSRQYLAAIQTPTVLVQAADDPFITPAVIPADNELASAVTLELYPHGGHVGFVSCDERGKIYYWLEDRVLGFVNQISANAV